MAVAYGAEPGVGSESGAGWVWATMLASLAETWVLTRVWEPEARERREAAVRQAGLEDRLHFVDVELPRWTRLWRRPDDTDSIRLQRLEYLIWQRAAARRGRALHRSLGFDLAWHLTWANIWGGSAAAEIDTPFVLGPVGGGVQPPWRLLPELGVRGAWFEVIRAIGQRTVRVASIPARRAWSRASLILVQNHETRAWLPSAVRERTVIFPNAVIEPVEPRSRQPGDGEERIALYAGNLIPLKGVALAIRVIARLPQWRFVICGDGPDAPRLQRLARRLGVSDRVLFLGRQERAEVLRRMRAEADVLLFPSFHDEGSWVTAEARSIGLPVVCLDRGGPPVLGAMAVPPGTREATVAALAAAVELTRQRPADPTDEFSFLRVRERLTALLNERGLLPVASQSDDWTRPAISPPARRGAGPPRGTAG